MLEDIIEWFSDLDGKTIGLALLFWALCLVLIWKFFDQNIMKLHLRVIMTIIMLPVCYALVYFISNKD